MFELMFGVTPFWSKNKFDMHSKILKGELMFPDKRKYQFSYSKEMTECIAALLNRDKD